MRNFRIPKDFVVVKGSGQSDLSRHPGSYHFALFDADEIHKYNLLCYSSVLHKDSNRLHIDQVDLPEHGSEMFCIMANAEGFHGDTINAGLVYAWLYSDKDLENKVGGFVCEVTNKGTVEQLEERMYKIINEGYEETFKKEGLYMGEPETITESMRVEKRYGNAVVAIVFVNYIE